MNAVLTTHRPAIAVHRGTAHGAVVENTVGAVTAALRSGTDMVEIDVVESTDGDYFVFHDGYEAVHFGTAWPLPKLSTAEIESLEYGARVAHPRVKVERLDDMLRSFPGVLFNIDRSWHYWPRLLAWLDQFDITDQLILKAPVQPQALGHLRSHPIKYPLLAIVRSPDDLDTVRTHPGINLVGAELVAKDPSHPFCDAAWIQQEVRDRGLFAYVNALDLGHGVPLMANWDDTVSVTGDPDEGWGRLVALGADVIQTDWPSLLRDYLREAGAWS